MSERETTALDAFMADMAFPAWVEPEYDKIKADLAAAHDALREARFWIVDALKEAQYHESPIAKVAATEMLIKIEAALAAPAISADTPSDQRS